jgi:hypothetical protein
MANKQTATLIAACCVCRLFDCTSTATVKANKTIGNKELSFMDRPLSISSEGVLRQRNEDEAAKFLLIKFR